jgi:hypothetical protein
MKILEVYNEVLNEDILYHGTPHKFLEFSTENMGGGEGNQAFGWGLYFTDSRGLAEHYARVLSNNIGYVYSVKLTRGNFLSWNKAIDEGMRGNIVSGLKKRGIDEMPIKRMLVGGKIEPVYRGVEEALGYYPTFKYLYENLAIILGSEKSASEFLFSCVIDGVRYAGDSLRNVVKGFSITGFNYVIFSGSVIRILDIKEIRVAS